MNRVREFRKAIGIQQKELAIAVGVSVPTISEWEHDKKDPSGERLQKLANYFGVEPIEIISSGNYQHRMPSDEEIFFALFGNAKNITEEDFQDVKNYVRFLIAKKNGSL